MAFPTTLGFLMLTAAVFAFSTARAEEDKAARDRLYQQALDFYHQGRLAEAEAKNRELIQIQQRLLGAEHPDTLVARNNLGLVLEAQNRLDEAWNELADALGYMRRAEQGYTSTLGADHAATRQVRDYRVRIEQAMKAR